MITGTLHTTVADYPFGEPRKYAEYRDGQIILYFGPLIGIYGDFEYFTLRSSYGLSGHPPAETRVPVTRPKDHSPYDHTTIVQPIEWSGIDYQGKGQPSIEVSIPPIRLLEPGE